MPRRHYAALPQLACHPKRFATNSRSAIRSNPFLRAALQLAPARHASSSAMPRRATKPPPSSPLARVPAVEPLQQMRVLSGGYAPGLNDAVFALRVENVRLAIASSDAVTAVAASGALLWVGTSSGRLIRLDTVTGVEEEVRGRLGVGKLDNAVWRIYADPYAHGALVILRNADGYHAHGTGLVRPRWLAKLRGLRCVSASWIRVPSKHPGKKDVPVALLGTAFGALFSLTVDDKYEKDDVLQRLWVAPNGERIDGIRVEQVAGKFVGTVATTSALYLFSDALSLADLFTEGRTTVVNRAPDTGEEAHKEEEAELVLPSELQFMTGNSGVASRRFVWAAAAGITHAQLSVKRRRNDEKPAAEQGEGSPRASRSTVIASVQDKDLISWARLKQTSGSAVPLACNLSAFHVLVLYPGSVYAFNQISGQLTQRITVWSPSGASVSAEKKSAEWPLGSRRRSPIPSELSSPRGGRESGKRVSLGWDEGASGAEVLSSPAAGFARDVLTDSLWIYTEDGEFSRLIASNEEQTEAWKAAKAMRRFDLAMALAPLVSSGLPDDTTMFQTREAVLEAQANHAASEGDWDVAAQLYAKTNRPIESVILDIVEACSGQARRKTPAAQETELSSSLRDLGIGPRLEMTKHIITYLVRKLDKTDCTKPMQRTIIATLLVQLYASQLSSETDEKLKEEVRTDFGHFLADRHKDLDTSTAIAILSKNGCHEEAWKLAVLSGDIVSASELLAQRGMIDQAISLLKNPAVTGDSDMMSQLIQSFSSLLVPQSPQKMSSAVARSLQKESYNVDHITVVQGLARVARGFRNEETANEAYHAATTYLFDLLHEWKVAAGKGDPSIINGKPSADWYNLVTFLFQLHAEFGTETEAQRSYDHLVAPRLTKDMSEETHDALGAILRSAASGGFLRLCVFLYQALELHVTAIKLAVEIDVKLAESKVGLLGHTDMPENLKKSLWCLVASKSDDPVGVVERSKGLLHIEDVLTSMGQFESATERVKTAVANSLEEHKRLANVAKSDATSALEVTSSLREDLEKARAWQTERQQQRHGHRHRSRLFSCGHRASVVLPEGKGKECALCGTQAVLSVSTLFDTGYALPLKSGKQQQYNVA